MGAIDELSKFENLDKAYLAEVWPQADTFEKKATLLMLETRNYLRSIRNMLRFYTILTIISLLIGFFIGFSVAF